MDSIYLELIESLRDEINLSFDTLLHKLEIANERKESTLPDYDMDCGYYE